TPKGCANSNINNSSLFCHFKFYGLSAKHGVMVRMAVVALAGIVLRIGPIRGELGTLHSVAIDASRRSQNRIDGSPLLRPASHWLCRGFAALGRRFGGVLTVAQEDVGPQELGDHLYLLVCQQTGVEARHRGRYGREEFLQQLGVGQLALAS